MLHFFTWQQFLVAAVIFTAVWYLVLALLFFRDKLAALLSGKSKNEQPEKLKREWEEELEGDPEEENDLIGEQAVPEGISEVEAHMLGFAPKVWDEDEADSREVQLGLVPDVLEELKTIFHILENEGGNAEDFVSLFGMVKTKYAGIAGSPNEAAINEYIRENAPFPISDEVLANLWN
ncbi:hypothetical protein BDD43_4520 [Mucilaginibacter gracilis]|uniref:Uncharacterized protein n=1 Tax=Mucilaginibacter gracilis TaxID=423350 RepID=A0A495J7B2_9SPHI|nr:hypothetical protein [Mucilaginibacter gracilis]RKR84288.1 hypothetical protein BDD43_4520 [Mucilaginibacter gracilis]